MADHGPAAHAGGDLPNHQATYAGFLKGAAALALICFYILVALVNFRFVSHPLNVFSGFAGLILGVIATLIDARAGNRWFLSGGLLVLFGLLTAINIS
jgi:hypothetical protein